MIATPLLAYCLPVALLFSFSAHSQNRDPLKTEIITTDLDNFWIAWEAASPDFKPETFQTLYLDRGSKGIKGFMKGRIESAENLAKVISAHANYYASIRKSTDSISGMEEQIRNSLVKLKALYPRAVFPPVYFVIGALNSGGTSSRDGLIIGAELFGLTSSTPTQELDARLRSVIKPAKAIPYIVAHELIHFQQNNKVENLLGACLHEGGADFIAELISGKIINHHIHDFANPKEKELWLEFKDRMLKKDYRGWLYSGSPGRPNDLGYWMGYQIIKSYYNNAPDKQKAINDILNFKDAEEFLRLSKYPEKFN